MTQQQKIPKLRFPEFQGMPEWEEKKLGRIAKIVMGQSPNSESYTNNPDDYVLVQGNADLKNGWVQPRVWTTSITKKANKGSLIFTVRAPVGEIGKTNYEVVLGRGVASINGNEFIYQYLVRLKAKNFWMTLSSGSIFASINSDTLKNTIIQIPSSTEQQKIADCLTSLDDRINAENDKLMQLKEHKKGLMQKLFPGEGQDRPDYRFPAFQNAPAWEEKRLAEVAAFYKGQGLPKSEIVGDGINECIHYGELFTQYSEVIINILSRTNKANGFLSKKYDVLMPTSDVTPNGLAKACCIGKSQVILGGDILVLRPIPKVIYGYFLSRYIRSIEIKILQLVTGTTVYHLYASNLQNLIIKIPILPEQQKIADCLTSLDDLITAQSKKIELLKAHKKGLMQQLFV